MEEIYHQYETVVLALIGVVVLVLVVMIGTERNPNSRKRLLRLAGGLGVVLIALKIIWPPHSVGLGYPLRPQVKLGFFVAAAILIATFLLGTGLSYLSRKRHPR